jgi:hypothetical protein
MESGGAQRTVTDDDAPRQTTASDRHATTWKPVAGATFWATDVDNDVTTAQSASTSDDEDASEVRSESFGFFDVISIQSTSLQDLVSAVTAPLHMPSDPPNPGRASMALLIQPH